MPPLTPAVVHILLSLADEERHGYGIVKDVLEQTDGRVRLGPGTIYGTLQRLMESGWVEETERPDGPEHERRRYYKLTGSGREAISTEMKRLDALVRIGRTRRVMPRSSRG